MAALRFRIFLFCLLLLAGYSAFSQIEVPDVSLSLGIPLNANEILKVDAPDNFLIAEQDRASAAREAPYRIGVEVPVTIDFVRQATWLVTANGTPVLRLALSCPGAEALGVYYKSVNIPEGGFYTVYNASGQNSIGVFNQNSFTGAGPFVTRPIPGDTLVLEYYFPNGRLQMPDISITGLQYIYRSFDRIRNPEGSGNCEVNSNCSEGDSFKDQKQSVVKILTTVAGSSFLCTGTIINNTSLDLTPYVLTANHCSEKFGTSDTASGSDLNKWIFYFNYESVDCKSNIPSSFNHTMTGATFVASSHALSDFGSDFFLLKLNQSIPSRYNPYYCGWKRINSPPVSGVCIHHPQGDVKKISTFTTPAVSSSWETTPDTHWRIEWAETTNGHGVTEGGSSGAPLLDLQGLITGTLTGGESGCSNLTGKDYFGKLSFSWEPSGSSSHTQLKYWLDPSNSGASQLAGIQNYKLISANIKADTSMIPVGGYVDFTDLSTGSPTTWHWFFEGGQPAESFDKNPRGINYNRIGNFDVKLIVSSEKGSDTLLAKDFIEVKALIYPNPTTGTVQILSKKWFGPDMTLEIIDPLGRIIQRQVLDNTTTVNSVDLPQQHPYYFLRLIWEEGTQTQKIILFKSNY